MKDAVRVVLGLFAGAIVASWCIPEREANARVPEDCPPVYPPIRAYNVPAWGQRFSVPFAPPLELTNSFGTWKYYPAPRVPQTTFAGGRWL